ncbi:MAG: FtsX-like permease family protein, partial [Flavobacteriaceae bacterium]|nr:FtsX-like permease family protein [Flavobacteriaceae bacterium]
MKTILKLAWRNIWRNKRRTLITVASIMFALFFAIIMRGFQKGSYAKMKENAIESYSGYIQIHKKGYWDDKNINNVFSLDKEITTKLVSDSRVIDVIPRLESFALASSGESTKGVVVMGVSPDKEDKMTKIKSYMQEGEFINEEDKAILVAADLAKFLKVEVGDTLVLFSSGYHGQTAAGLYPVKGILKLPTPEMNKGTVYLPIKEAQYFFSTDNQLTALVFDLHDIDDAKNVQQEISKSIDLDKYEVMGWEVMNKELLQMIESDNAGGVIMIAILYLVIAFGIFGTVLMMTNERIREFSVMISVGMQKSKLALVVIIELFFLTTLAVIAGIIISLPVMIYFVYNPIRFSGEALEAMKDFNFEPVMPISMEPEIFIMQAISISIISLIAMSYPTIKIMTLDVVNGLRS